MPFEWPPLVVDFSPGISSFHAKIFPFALSKMFCKAPPSSSIGSFDV